MIKFLLTYCFVFSLGAYWGQKDIESQLKETKYPKPGNSDLKKEWRKSPSGIVDFNTYSNEEETAPSIDVDQKTDSILEQHHTTYQKYLSKKKAREKNLLKEPELPEMPAIEGPEIEEPDLFEPGKVPSWILKLLLFIVVGIGLIFLFYTLIKNSGKLSRPYHTYDEFWNPEIVPVSDLEKRLETALKKENYREAIRIYFTLILKELIRLKQIKWHRDKTNHDYLFQMKSVVYRPSFGQCVHIFEVVWYGDYAIDRSRYEEICPVLQTFLSTLKSNE